MEKLHVICHVHSLDHPAVFKIVNTLVINNSRFTGEKIVTISKSSRELEVFNIVKKIFEKLNYTIFEVENAEYREASHFFNTSLPYLLSKTSDGILLYCHSKGVSYHPDSDDGKATSLWTDVLIDNVITKPIIFEKKHSTWGSCITKTKNFLPEDIGEKFCFIGTFWWIRVEKLVDANIVPHSKFHLEGLPGLVCNLIEAKNYGPEFKPNESPYQLSSWKAKGYDIR